jgi:hypothetical protein
VGASEVGVGASGNWAVDCEWAEAQARTKAGSSAIDLSDMTPLWALGEILENPQRMTTQKGLELKLQAFSISD